MLFRSSGKLIVSNDVTLPDIILEGNPSVTIENAGTINAIKMGESSALTINNSGTINNAIEMGKTGTLTIENSSKIASIKTPIPRNGDNLRTITVMNYSAGVIDEIYAPNTTLTVRNDGTVEKLTGFFYLNIVKLLRGAGRYTNIYSKEAVFNDTDLQGSSVIFSEHLEADDYFYFFNDSTWLQKEKDYEKTRSQT